jgi:hypothetical protein
VRLVGEREVAAARVEVELLAQRQVAAVVEERAAELDVAQRRRLERALDVDPVDVRPGGHLVADRAVHVLAEDGGRD